MIEIEREDDRVVLRRGFLEDPRLSFRAKGLLAYLLSRPAGEGVDPQNLARASGERTADVEATLRQLESAGYFTRAEGGPIGTPQVSGVVRETSLLPLLESVPRRASAGSLGAAHAAEDGDDGARKAAAERILARLNELRKASWTWARYTPLSARHAKNVEHIRGRLHEGYEEADLILVLEYLATVDGGKDASRKYFDSVTPFNTKNFERNLAMARDWDARGRPEGDGTMALQRSYGHDPAIYQKKVKGGAS
jgi:hypothetical protein